MLHMSSPDDCARISRSKGSLFSHPVRRTNGTVPNSAARTEQGAPPYFNSVFTSIAPTILSAWVLLHIVHFF